MQVIQISELVSNSLQFNHQPCTLNMAPDHTHCNYSNICLQVKFGFLPVGHTHEDIDQLFSCISRRLKHRSALTVEGKIVL